MVRFVGDGGSKRGDACAVGVDGVVDEGVSVMGDE